jgi:hypothetical protein
MIEEVDERLAVYSSTSSLWGISAHFPEGILPQSLRPQLDRTQRELLRECSHQDIDGVKKGEYPVSGRAWSPDKFIQQVPQFRPVIGHVAGHGRVRDMARLKGGFSFYIAHTNSRR